MEPTCSMVGCNHTTNNSTIHFFPFPKDFDLCHQWVQNCRRSDLMTDFMYEGCKAFLNKFICSAHFRLDDYLNPHDCNIRLKSFAVPVASNDIEPGHDPECIEIPTIILKTEVEQDSKNSTEIVLNETINQEHQLGIGSPPENLKTDSLNFNGVFIKEEPVDRVDGFIDEYPCSYGSESGNNLLVQSTRDPQEIERYWKDKDLLTTFIKGENDTYSEQFERPRNNANRKLQTNKKVERHRKQVEKEEKKSLRTQKDKIIEVEQRKNETLEQTAQRVHEDAYRVYIKTENESDDDKLERNQVNAFRNAIKRATETEEQKRERLQRNAHRNAIRRSMETLEEKLERRRKNAERVALKRMIESEEEKLLRRQKDRIRSAERRKHETPEQTQYRRYVDAVRSAFRRCNETEEQRKERREADIARAARRKLTETKEQRELRLKTDRERAARRRMLLKFSDRFDHWCTLPNLGGVPSTLDMPNSSNIIDEGAPSTLKSDEFNYLDCSKSESSDPLSTTDVDNIRQLDSFTECSNSEYENSVEHLNAFPEYSNDAMCANLSNIQDTTKLDNSSNFVECLVSEFEDVC